MALELVGAVGVKVRPDARGFRREAKREILDQLRGLEEEIKVRVDPDLQVDRRRAQQAMEKAFGDLKGQHQRVPVRVEIAEEIDTTKAKKRLEQKLADELGDASTIRLKADTRDAEKSVSDLERKMDDLADEAERLPKALEDASDEYSNMLKGNESSLRKLKDAASDLNNELEGLDKQREQQRQASKAANIEQRIADKSHKQSLREVADLEKKIADLGKVYRDARGAENRAIIKAERDALKEQLAGLKQERAELRSMAAERKKYASEQSMALTKLDNQYTKANGQLKKNEQIQRDINANQAQYIKDQEAKIKAIEAEIKAHKGNTTELAKQLEVERAILDARKKSNDELLDSAMAFDPLLVKWNEYKQGIEDGTNDNVRYFGLMALKHKEMTKSQMEDLRELEQREREAFQVRQKHYKEYGQFVDLFNRKGIVPEMQKIMDKQKVKVQVEVDRAALQLSLQSIKPMRIPVTMFLADQARWGGDVAKAISGWGIMRDMQQMFKDTAANLDELSISTAKMAVAGTSLFSVLGGGAGVLAATGKDLGKLVRGALIAPAALMALGSAGFVVARAFSGFGKAIAGDEASMQALAPTARKAAQALQGLGLDLDNAIGPAVWKSIDSSMYDAISNIQGPLIKGLTKTGTEMGFALKGVFNAFDDFASSGSMTRMFDLMNKGFQNSRAALGNFTRGFLDLSVAGAKVLPELGTAVDNVAESFAKWSRVNRDNGNIEKWLREAGQEAKHMSTIMTQAVGVVGALGTAAERAGFGGLGSMAQGLTKINQAARGEFFQSNMATIFEGAGEASRRMGEGFKSLGTAVLTQAPLIGRSMKSSGTIVQNVLNGMAEGFTNTRLTQGVDTFFNQMVTSSGRLQGIIPKVAQSIGDFLPLAGNLADGALKIADSFMDLWNRSDKLVGALTRVTPVLADLVVGFIELSHGPLVLLADGLASVIDFFTALPGPIQQTAAVVALAAAGFALLAKSMLGITAGAMRVAPALTQMGRAAQTFANTRSPLQSFNTLLGNTGVVAGRAQAGMDKAASGAGKLSGDLFTARSGLVHFGTATTTAATSAGTFSSKVGSMGGAAGKLRGALSGVTGFLGGPWGVAFMVAGAAIAGLTGKMAANAAEMKGHVDSIKPTLGSLGQFTAETARVVASNMNEIETSFSFGDLIHDEVSTVGEAFQRLGTSSSDMADMMVNNRSEFDHYAKVLQNLEPPLSMGANRTKVMADAQQQLADKFGISKEYAQQNASALVDAGEAMAQQAEAADRASRAQSALGGKFQSAVGQTQAYGDAMKVLGDSSLSASDKLQALQSAIDGYNNGAMASADASYKFQSGLDQAEATAQQFISSQKTLGNVLKDNGTNIDMAASGGKELYEVMKMSSGSALEYALSLRDAGASATEIKGALAQGRSEFVANAEAMGMNATEAGKLYDAMNKIPTELESRIALEGADEAFAKAKQLSETLGIEFDGKEFMAMLDADPELAKLAATDAQAAAEAWANKTYLAGLDLDAGDVMAVVEAAKAKGLEWDSEKFMALLDANPDAAKMAKDDIEGLLREYENFDYETDLDANTSQAEQKLDSLNQKLKAAETTTTIKAELTANDSNFQAVIDRAKAKGDEIKDPDRFKAWIDANLDGLLEKKMTVDQIIDEYNNSNPQAKFDADNSSAIQKADEMEIATSGWDGQIFSATLDADGSGVPPVVAAAEGLAKNWDFAEFAATLMADETSVPAKVEAAKGFGLNWAREKFEALFGGDTGGVDEAKAEADNKGSGWDSSTFVDAQLGARSERVDFAVDNAIAAAERWNGKVVDAELGARSERVAGAVANALAAAAPWDGKAIDAQLGARSERVAGAVANAMMAAAPWDGKAIDAQLGARSERVSLAVANAVAAATPWNGRVFDAQLGARSERVAGAIANAVAVATTWVGRVFDAQLGARSERVGMALGNANAIASPWRGQVFDAQFGARTERVAGARGNANAIGGAWRGSSFDAQFGARTERVSMALANAMARGNSWRASSFDAQFGGRTERVDIAKANADARGWHWMGSNFDAQFGARIGGVYSAYGAALAVGYAWSSRVFTATLTARKAMADGGFAFAEGGIIDQVIKQRVQRFANGGIDRESAAMQRALSRKTKENHRAQIATPVTPFRVWAEPETGGEAYIPLASSKRARSTQIWEETGDLLGVKWEAYAQGGVRGKSSDPTRTVTQASGSRTPVHVEITNNYPVAEPASVTTNKALQFAAAMI